MVVKSYLRGCGIEVVNGDALSFKENFSVGTETCRDQIFHNFLLGVDRDTVPRQGFEIDAMPLLSETNFHAIVDQAFPLHSLADAHFDQKVDGALLEDSGSHPLLTVLASFEPRPQPNEFLVGATGATRQALPVQPPQCRPGFELSSLLSS